MRMPYLFIDVDGVMAARELGWSDARPVKVTVERPGLRATMPLTVSDALFRRLERMPAEVHLLTYWCEHNAFDDIVAQAAGPRFANRVVAPFPSWALCGGATQRQVALPLTRQATLASEGDVDAAMNLSTAFESAALSAGRIEADAPPVACASTSDGCGLSHPPQPRDITTAHRYVSDPHWKPRYIAEVLRRDPRPFAWVDDEEAGVYGAALRSRVAEPGQSLVLAPQTLTGLSVANVYALEAFLSSNGDHRLALR